MRRVMAVFDVDPFYADKFAEFVNQKETVPFTAVPFTSLERLKEFANEEPVELLLAGDEVEAAALQEVKAEQIVRLSETKGEQAEIPTVYKYQASDGVLREVMACYQVRETAEPLTLIGARSRIVGVYSPVGRCGKTGFAVTLGQVLARDSRVLYLNLEEFSGFGRLLGSEYEGNFSDLIYYYRQGEYGRMRLGSLVYSLGGLDYVPPVSFAEDLAVMDGVETAELIDRMARENGYDVVILDPGHFLRNVEAILALCDVIYSPVKEDVVSEAKMEEWRHYLEVSGRMKLWEKVQIMKLPRQMVPDSRRDYFEQLLWGDMGDFVRELTGRSGRSTR
ncbi:MAG: hypothetical protein LUC94_13965 [Clostridiales bacterium]|nr:hypothetical protein [Clostridiales bacterium]